MQNATFLFATGNFARLSLSSHLISFNYETAAINARIPGHRQFVVLRDENLGAICIISGPSTVQVKCVGCKAKYHSDCDKEYSLNRA
jgi:hypothetical protein